MYDSGSAIFTPSLTCPVADTRTSEGVVFVVDSTDRDRVTEAREMLHVLLKDDELAHLAVLILANKQDLPTALTPPHLVDDLQLHSIKQLWHIQVCNI